MSWREGPLPRCSISTASRLVRRLPRPQQPVADARARRDARHHRPQRRRQDDDDGHHHRQDQARRRRRCCSTASTDLTRLDETAIAKLGIGRKFQKPTVFESQTVEDNLLLALNVDHRVTGTLFWRGSRDEAERIDRVLETIRLDAMRATGSPAACRTARSSGSRSACCWRRTRSCCWSTSRSPA